ncbi:UDP-glucose pyrophosphorylase [Georgenia satyanarayanai]|uniref:UTP--glucose-1-phosphate uridylyltransferase n=1 Tax=Georgenia satyanarayanai TaxID=860221 RepID=A0A2Y9A5K5_9MICO|nr:UTP--glucose-1-phosphate uridylyltransferase [Georgenia satyanarayanai]PYG00947.1 UDP-glucose pyrophosphorylase [Georgenia satyanarayanai]SSA39186.1 UDP-glucose pyrophosphorylase [Georgenia satyanarayanai]
MTEQNITPVRKAVVPVAGLGTRFVPATKAVAKEMLPVVDRPAIQYVVEEVAAAGIEDLLLVTARGKSAIEDHFDRNVELEAALEAKGDDDRLAEVRRPTALADIHAVRQGTPKGLGHAVLCGREHVGDEPFAVLLGDDLIDARDPILPTMIDVQQRLGGSVIALLEVEPSQINLYGAAAVEPVSLAGIPDGDVVTVTELVEKPPVEEAPSNLALIGRYVLSPAVFDVLEKTEPGRGNEIQLTDALQTLARMPASEGGGVHGVVFRGRRYDTGDKLDYLKAVVQLAVDREDLGPDFSAWLEQFVAGRHVELSSDPSASHPR